MATGLVFQFRIGFDPATVPPGMRENFEEALRDEALLGEGYDCYVGALGGSCCVYGVVYREDGNVTLADRDKLEAWIKRQPVRCNVGLGDLEPMEQADILRRVMERQFQVDNFVVP